LYKHALHNVVYSGHINTVTSL